MMQNIKTIGDYGWNGICCGSVTATVTAEAALVALVVVNDQLLLHRQFSSLGNFFINHHPMEICFSFFRFPPSKVFAE